MLDLSRWNPLVRRAAILKQPCAERDLARLDALFEATLREPGTKFVVPPSLDSLLHLAAEADFLPHRLARASGRDLHHVVVENEDPSRGLDFHHVMVESNSPRLQSGTAASVNGHDFHHLLVENDGHARFPTGSAYAAAGVDGFRLMPGSEAEVFTQPGCAVWCEPFAA